MRSDIKILNDKDVVVSRKAESVKTIRGMLIDNLDLDYEARDIDLLTVEGINAIENRETEDVAETIQLFAELLTLDPLPKAFHADDRDLMMVGRLRATPPSGYEAESIVIYDGRSNALKFLSGPLTTNDIGDMQRIDLLFKNKEQADLEGGAVFDVLRQRVIREKPVVN
jgi:hypothetical protein